MLKLFLSLAGAVFLGLGFVTAPHAAFAAAQTCSGTVTGHVTGGLVVNSGDTCIVNSAQVSGGIQVNGGTLYVCASKVDGGIQGTTTGLVRVGETDLSGQVGLPSGLASCPGDTVNGGVQLSGTGFVEIDASTVNGGANLNTTGSGYGQTTGGEVEGSTFHGDLSCTSTYYNDTARSNTVSGQDACPSVH